MDTFEESCAHKKIRVSKARVRGKEKWKVDLRQLGKGRRYFDEESEAHKFVLQLEDKRSAWNLSSEEKIDAKLALDILGEKASLLKAARFYAKHFSGITEKRIPEAVEEFLAEKYRENLSVDYFKSLKIRLRKFAKCFKGNFDDLFGAGLRDWVASLEMGPRTRKNYCDSVRIFLNWAILHRYLSKKWDGWAFLKVRVPTKSRIDIYTPSELRRLINHSPDSMIPFMVLGAFAGLRTAEIKRLNWAAVGTKYIEVNAEASKVGLRRLVEITPNLRAWLDTYQSFGKIVKVSSGNYFQSISKKAGVPWKRNALRHSWFSYKLSLVQDPAKVAYEGNNSPQIIFRNYREVVTPEQAEEWFSITPGKEIKPLVEVIS